MLCAPEASTHMETRKKKWWWIREKKMKRSDKLPAPQRGSAGAGAARDTRYAPAQKHTDPHKHNNHWLVSRMRDGMLPKSERAPGGNVTGRGILFLKGPDPLRFIPCC